jgi:hypothetical protein
MPWQASKELLTIFLKPFWIVVPARGGELDALPVLISPGRSRSAQRVRVGWLEGEPQPAPHELRRIHFSNFERFRSCQPPAGIAIPLQICNGWQAIFLIKARGFGAR